MISNNYLRNWSLFKFNILPEQRTYLPLFYTKVILGHETDTVCDTVTHQKDWDSNRWSRDPGTLLPGTTQHKI